MLVNPALIRRARRSAQRGMSLIFSLITLVALSLAAVALIRSVDTGSTILGNLSFKQDTLLAADDASRQAVQWLADNSGSLALQGDIATQGYSASLITQLDPTGSRPTDTTRVVIDWDWNDCASYTSSSYARCFKPRSIELDLSHGVKARWVILRVCNTAGDPTLAAVACAKPVTASSGGSTERGDIRYDDPRLQQAVLAQYFRVIVRAQGGRKTTSTTETLVHF
jgi:type IV pilus assembly protein PilX